MAFARCASVTVSMAADTSGRFREILREKRVAREVSLGRTWENAGTSNTSSKVSALPRRRIWKLQKTDCTRGPFSHSLGGEIGCLWPTSQHPLARRWLIAEACRYTAPHETFAFLPCCPLGRRLRSTHEHTGPVA